MLDSTRGTRNRYSEPSPGTDDDFLAAILVRMWALASGRPLPRNVRPGQLSTEELIAFWADDLSPAAGRHAAGVPSYDVGRLMSQISLEPAADPAGGQVRAMLAFGILGSFPPDRNEEVPGHLDKALDEIVWEALEGSGLPWDRCHREDRGDGALVVLPPGSAADGVIDPLPERLRRLIRLHNRMSGPAAQMQVRAAAHIGPVYRGDHGLVGDGIDQLFRMMHARPLQTALAGSGAELALAVSRSMRHSVVRRRPALAGLRPFRPIDTHVKGTRVSAWIYLPGVPPALQAGVTGRLPAGKAPPAPARGSSPRADQGAPRCAGDFTTDWRQTPVWLHAPGT
jgi:class 3 adenylate cyclase